MSGEKKERRRSRLLTGILVGSVVGMTVAMFDRTTREHVTNKARRCGQRTITWIKEVRTNPEAFLDNVKHQVQKVSQTAKDVADDIQLVFSKLNEVKETSSQAMETAKEAGEEMKEIGRKIIRTEENQEDRLSK